MPNAQTGGERVVFSPKESPQDILFSTWGVDEYEDDGSKNDPCVGDYAYGKVLILNKRTGLLGTGKVWDEEAGGFVVTENTPGASSGGITESSTSGESYGKSTLNKNTIDALNKFASSSHEEVGGEICTGNVADDSANVYDFTVDCKPPVRTSKRLSIRKIL